MHQANRIIHDEHQALAAMLHALRSIGTGMKGAGSPREFSLLRAMLFYIDEFPERLHHPKESQLLFPRLRARSSECSATLDRLDDQHVFLETAIRKVERALLAYEQLGESRRETFITTIEQYIANYRGHMQLEETEIMPLAERVLTVEDWDEIDAAFAANRDPLTGHEPSDEYRALFRRIVNEAPAPIGLG